MSYTMTFDVSHRVGDGGGHRQIFFRHIARDADEKAGFAFAHANKNIVPERTRFNFTRVNDGAGAFRALESVDGRPPSQEFEDYLVTRRATVTGRKRKDAKPIRGVILQLDPKWFDDHNPNWRTTGPNEEAIEYMDASLVWACNEFSQENIVGFSLHLDEYSPQLQVLVTPVTPDGRLSQKDFFKSPADLRRQHKELRAHMESVGYDVEMRVTERSREHLSSSEFQAKANRLRDATQDAEAEKSTYETLLVSLENRAKNLDGREDSIAARERALDAASADARRAQDAAETAQRAASRSRFAAQRAIEETEQERELLRATNERLQRVPADVDRWLDKTKIGGRPLREAFDDDMARARKARAEVGRLIDDDSPLPEARNVNRGDARRSLDGPQ
ncbi:plasmid recombination protein [Curtobacterium sp. MCBA15_001]|uniref:plasmid recombination protein n=1 Tax=Curtobacterium sp. MCBA15_001 TaxID=1898731 RepID=UPI0008DCE334|nr:plasmid recombination protein [Curtobacterium sp. MCBA15_001]OIH92444.1 hypothetical protein BIU90_11185 [Curtobacterium sp. MCBA15_001]